MFNLLLLIGLAAPFVLLLATPWCRGRRGARAGWVALIAPVVSTTAFALLAARAEPGAGTVVTWPWIPTLGLNLVFLVDGLSLFFALVVSGMGALVVGYATQYLDGHYPHQARFYSYLLLFMGAMLGTVLAGNLLLVFVCWELTGIASFLLIGFLHHQEESRAGARMALLITAGTGLVMLAGVALVGWHAGTYELAALLGGALDGAPRGVVTAALLLIAIGAFGKSAQFPFHFWLPNAMAAPTPVSAYLHSATMVKLGVYLVARIFPVFQSADLWVPLIGGVALLSVALAAVLALLSHDLKAILAYTTVGQLGALMSLYALAPRTGAAGDLLQIANHVFYKGCLFMVVGIIDHATHERDARRLGGLRRRLPLLAGIMAVAAASMAGVPGTLGFVSKEFLLAEQWARAAAAASGWAWVPLVTTALAALLTVAIGARIVFSVFAGPESEAARRAHAPGLALQAAPLVLAAACLGFGLFPDVLGQALQQLRVTGLHAMDELHFAVWHGVNRELLLSLSLLVAGGGLYLLLERRRWRIGVPAWLAFDRGFEGGVELLPRFAARITTALRSDRPFDYLPWVMGTLVVLVGGSLVAGGTALWPEWSGWAGFHGLRTFIVALVGVAVVLVTALRRWTGQLIALSIVGFLITFYFVLYRAPDLAMTQILVESATLLLVLLLLARFPRSAEQTRASRLSGLRRIATIALSAGVGIVTTWLALLALSPRSDAPAGDYYLESTVPLAHGTNAVNTILVDFRGFDTLLEITVLLIATLGAAGLFLRYRRTPEEYAAGPMGPAGMGTPGRRDAKEVRT